MIFVPLISKDQVIGVLLLQLEKMNAYSIRDSSLAESISTHIAGAIANAQLFKDRKRAEEEIYRQSALLDAINKVFREVLMCETEEELASMCLSVTEKLTGSKFGFIGELNQAGLLDTLAISNPGWNACKMPMSEASLLIKNMEVRGIWSSVLKNNQSIIINDPTSHPDRVGIPDGHPPIISFLGVPLKQGGRTIGIIAIANKESGYDLVDQHDVETLSIAFVEALMRKRAEKALRQGEERFRQLYDEAPVGYQEVDAEGRITRVNRTELEMLGYTAEEMLGQFLWKFNVEEEISRQSIMAKMAGTIPPGRAFERIYRKKDGTTIPVLLENRLLQDEEGRIIRMRSTIQDITDRNRAEEALRKSEAKFKDLFDEAPVGYVELDTEGRITQVNRTELAMLGYTA